MGNLKLEAYRHEYNRLKLKIGDTFKIVDIFDNENPTTIILEPISNSKVKTVKTVDRETKKA